MSEESGRRSQILEAAAEEFAARGFSGATIKAIARRAELQSAALIYWYFPTKEALFAAVTARHWPVLEVLSDPAPLLKRPPGDVLPLLARAYVDGANRPEAERVVRLIAPEVIRRPEIADLVAQQLIAPALDFLTTYFTHQIAMGRLRPHDVRASARAFVGMILPLLGSKTVFPALQADGPSDDEHIATVVEIFLRGLHVEDAPLVAGEAAGLKEDSSWT